MIFRPPKCERRTAAWVWFFTISHIPSVLFLLHRFEILSTLTTNVRQSTTSNCIGTWIFISNTVLFLADALQLGESPVRFLISPLEKFLFLFEFIIFAFTPKVPGLYIRHVILIGFQELFLRSSLMPTAIKVWTCGDFRRFMLGGLRQAAYSLASWLIRLTLYLNSWRWTINRLSPRMWLGYFPSNVHWCYLLLRDIRILILLLVTSFSYAVEIRMS